MGQETSRRGIGRPRSIDRDKIIAAANHIGIEHLTMRAIAEHLGVTTQALYNHIGGRRELLTLMANDYGELIELEPDDFASWQDWLRSFARSLTAHLAERPGLAGAVVTRGPTSPAALRFIDATISKMAADGFAEQTALRAYRAVLEIVVGWVQRNEARSGEGANDQAHRTMFYEAVSRSDLDHLPHLAHIAAGWNRRDEELFDYMLDALIAGIDALRDVDPPGEPTSGTAGTAEPRG